MSRGGRPLRLSSELRRAALRYSAATMVFTPRQVIRDARAIEAAARDFAALDGAAAAADLIAALPLLFTRR